MPLIMPKNTYRSGELIVGVQYCTIEGYLPSHAHLILALGWYDQGMLNTHFGLSLYLDGERTYQHLHDAEDWFLDENRNEVLGCIPGTLNLNDNYALRQYLSQVSRLLLSDQRYELLCEAL